jgi:Xaa-Pro aminopeptidase
MKFDRVAQRDEVAVKRARLVRLMKEHGLDTVVLSRRHNFSWASGGADNHVRHSSEFGVASLIFHRDGRKAVLTSTIESPRIMTEELAGLGFKLREVRWYAPSERVATLREIIGRGKAASDDGTPGTVDVEGYLPALRMNLTDHELAKCRWLGRAMGEGIAEACRKVKKGTTEEAVAGDLFAVMQRKSVKPTVLLVAADERIMKYRHPIPTAAKVREGLMVVLCARRWGLVCSVTRLVRFGPLSPELVRKHAAVTHIDSVFINETRPGAVMADVFDRARETYALHGYGEEWKLHHQGGPTGYVEREFTVNPETPRSWKVAKGMAFAWNPSITGTKSEDTILVGAKGCEIITASPGWPLVRVSVAGKVFPRADWLLKK